MPPAHERRLAVSLDETSPVSAAVVAPMLLTLTGARSVLDVGCGTGAWLLAFERLGIGDTFGIDSMRDEFAPERRPERFRAVDLEAGFSLDRQFDLAVCLEVAEHLPASSAERIVDALVNAAPVIAFSAAIPDQGGIDHLNEQWPSYWRELFEAKDYRQHDVVRPAIWFDERVAYWYRQNLFVYAIDGWGPVNPIGSQDIRDWVVHPEMYKAAISRSAQKAGLGSLIRSFPGAIANSLRARRRGQ